MAVDLGALDAVLARDMNDIPDLPEYKTPPPGVYKILIESIKPEEVNEKTVLRAVYVVDQVIELADPETPEETQVKAGDHFSENFYFNDAEKIETTLGVLKKKFAGLAEILGTTNLKEILTGAVGMSVQCVITNRAGKADPANPKSKPTIYAQTRDIVPAV